jgi:DNA-binding NtrC family response regulator
VAEIAQHPDLVGQSAAMKRVFDAIETVGPTDATVLITGESGTGKELVARAIHGASPRRFHPMVTIHCGALTETLLESELFGHEKGAFTGAQYRKKGKFEIAEGGTAFLDEIGDISLKTQTDLLRVLQEREIVRVGGNQTIKVDFRCVAATNKDLEQLIDEGKFRPDLFYRLNVFRIELPALRERKEDIPLLVDHFVRKFSLQMNKKITRVAPAAMYALQAHLWPGNVRELENAVERAMVVAQEPELREGDFILKPRNGTAPEGAKTLEDIEKAHILKVLEECNWNQTRTAEVLDIDRVTLHNKLKKYGWSRGTVPSNQ